MNDEGVCRTVPATPGLLMMMVMVMMMMMMMCFLKMIFLVEI